jgi:hypothetical protein
MGASSLWNFATTDFPADGSPRQKLGFALKYAALAPTERQWQWSELRLADTHIELRARDDSALETIDPEGRELMIGCGAALLYLKTALKHFGCLGRVDLFPDLDQPALVARINFGFCRPQNEQERTLFTAMTDNRANAATFGEPPISETMLAALSQAVAAERGWLEFAQSETSRHRVVEIAFASEQRAMGSTRAPDRSASAPSSRPTSRWPKPLFAFGGRQVDPGPLPVEPALQISIPAAALAVVKTKTDDKHGWLAAGQTMARAVLQAQALGLSWALFNQVRQRQAREALRQGIGHKGFAQLILRFGILTPAETFQPPTPTTATATFR